MKLIVDVIEGVSVYQTVRRDKNTIVVAIRPHVYRHGTPAGSIRAVVQDTEGATVATGDWVTITDIGSDTYFHGYVRLDIKAHLRADTDYRILFETTGYTYTSTSYVGVCNGYDLGRYPATYTTGTSGYLHPLDLEIWERNA